MVRVVMSGLADAIEAAVREAHEHWVGPVTGLRPGHSARLGIAHHKKEGTPRQSGGKVVSWEQILLSAEETADIEAQVRAEIARVPEVRWMLRRPGLAPTKFQVA